MSSETPIQFQRRTVRERLARAYEQAKTERGLRNIKLAHSVLCKNYVYWDQFYWIAVEAAAEVFKQPWTHVVMNIGFSTCIVFQFVQGLPAVEKPVPTKPVEAGPPVYKVPPPPSVAPSIAAPPSVAVPGGPLHYKHTNPLAAATPLPS